MRIIFQPPNIATTQPGVDENRTQGSEAYTTTGVRAVIGLGRRAGKMGKLHGYSAL
jgi:hypothetical protein